ncbi:hypothetical protein L596_014988 [Steinernema carpocapsae]|uniref:Uncharacterized protein n=1 Tax=Steinernema carpocapsae TaxID=34508 RepID=A0A4V6A2Z5_STECR|nr:hypothetical protein L596_014988 [Steinernema carpocapsae]
MISRYSALGRRITRHLPERSVNRVCLPFSLQRPFSLSTGSKLGAKSSKLGAFVAFSSRRFEVQVWRLSH